MKRLYVLIFVLVLCAFMICSLCYADDNILYGCYKKNDGQLRIVNQAGQCLPSEISISWNKTGPEGPQGTTGVQGPAGPPGPPGISVQSTILPEGDPDCPYGGILFASASGVTYACNGEGTGGVTITIRRMATGQCTNGYGWCPNGYKSFFVIQDSAVNESSVITINVFNPLYAFYRGCEVSSIKAGEFRILCNGWNYIENGAILNYAVFNQ